MSKSQNKAAVLRILKERDAPISLPELLEVLGQGYSARTVRRWLSEWIDRGIVLKKGEKRGTRYGAIKETDQADIYFSQDSQKVINKIACFYF